MHRTIPVSRLFFWSNLCAGLALLVSLSVASAQDLIPVNLVQEQPKKDDTPTVVMMAPGTTHTHTSNEVLKRVENNNPKVINVSLVKDGTNKKVLFDAVGPGRARVTLTDMKDRIETIDVVVVSDRVRELREAFAKIVPSASITVTTTNGDNTVILTGYVLNTGDARVVQQTAANMFGMNVINNIQIGGVQQVQLEVIVAEVNRTEARNMSFSWMHQGSRGFVGNIFGTPNPLTVFSPLLTTITAVGSQTNPTGFNAVPAANVPFGVVTDKNGFLGFLQVLRQEQLAKIYAEPRLVTLSGRPGRMNVGGETPIILPTGVGSPPSITYKPFGTTVEFLPVVLGNGKIHLEVRPSITAIDPTITTGGSGVFAPAFKARSAEVAVQIEDGQTLAIGGLIQNSVTATMNKVPVLGDLPFIGAAFSTKSYQEVETELIILVTPRLVDPIDCTKIPKYLPGRETRGPDDYELFLEGIMEAPRGQRTVIFHPHHYQAAHRHASNISQYPCGNGMCDPLGGCANGSCGAPSLPMSPALRVQNTSPVTIDPESTPASLGQAPNLAPAVPTPQTNSSTVVPNRNNLPPVSFGTSRR